MGWAAVLRFVSMIKSFQPAQPGSFQWVDSTKATKKPSIHVARLALPTVRLHRYYKLLLWPIPGSLHQSIHSCCGNTPFLGRGQPKLRVHVWAIATSHRQPFRTTCRCVHCHLQRYTCWTASAWKTCGPRGSMQQRTLFHMPSTCWLCCGSHAALCECNMWM